MAAREEDANRPEAEEDGSGETSEAQAPAGGASALLLPDALVRISIGIIILGVMSVGAFIVITDVIAPRLGPVQPIEEEPEPEVLVEPPGEQWVIADVIVNPAGTRGKRYLRLGVALETRDGPLVLAELDSRRAQMRDLLIRKFSARTIDELSDPTVREEIRLSCIEEINANLGDGQIEEMYFTDYVLQ
jgi:flagellar basal body-associated protein FliL